ncbi:hypothetical protein NN3_23860 [Nocardia neocaledoniensis NBRC 108232]|uniref:Uncharacterized protein (TIGR02246 family) n=1 Tax=Nocardia neocaledoniensis TaxID=236511 RepID=A0A317N3M1_9NOCA|nr:SgcJ/EcaC family oxidoreductase [Nocardia neocaledoniensis]PWV69860.1 uncharacterized protein (TIGR02246 family) [Nocardia neocaledoniensis]GEM31379.1 hypothetical protein NN3_23860 [Nocardia neocaledoniensis NBRC 108232]
MRTTTDPTASTVAPLRATSTATQVVTAAPDPADDVALAALFDDFLRAWTAGDAAAFGALFTADSDYVSYDGSVARGRPAHQHNHDQLFRGVLTGSALVGDLESVRHLAPGVALLHGTGSVLMPWRSRLPRRRLSRQTIVAVRTAHGWKIDAIHNGRVRPIGIPAPDSPPARMSRLLTRIARALGLGRA